MKPATGRMEASMAGLIAGVITFYMYSRPYLLLGAIVGAAVGAVTYALLMRDKIRTLRRAIIITLAIVVWLNLFIAIAYLGWVNLIDWIEIHERFYYLPEMSTTGFSYIPCTRFLPQLISGTVVLGEAYPVGTIVNFPSTFASFLMILVPYILTFILFGRGWCGWMCCFGGTAEAFASGEKERWKMSKFREKFTVEGGSKALGGLLEEVRDVKYGFLLGILLLLTVLLTPVFCIVCWAVWLQYLPILLLAIGIFIVFLVILPFMTKRRWWCVICPVGAMFTLFEKISPFRIKIDKDNCTKCYDCMHECREYALTPQAIEETGEPTLECNKCGRCIETCPEEAVDLYLRGTSVKARAWFIPLIVAATALWYAWFPVATIQLISMIFGFK